MKYSYTDTINDYLEGHISIEEADSRLNMVDLTAQQAAEWNRLKEIDRRLSARAQRGPELPWLEVSVMNRIEAREKARQWIKSNPAGLFKGLRLPLLMKSIAFWQVVLVALASGVGGYWLGLHFNIASSLGLSSPAGFSVALVSALLGAGLGAVAAAFPRIRSFYS